jgi:hypothetical protein
MRFFLERNEYLIGVTTNLQFASREVAKDIGQLWSGQDHRPDLNFNTKQKILKILSDHIRFEYTRRCRRHAFYEAHGLGGRTAVEAIDKAVAHLEFARTPNPPLIQTTKPRTRPRPSS